MNYYFFNAFGNSGWKLIDPEAIAVLAKANNINIALAKLMTILRVNKHILSE